MKTKRHSYMAPADGDPAAGGGAGGAAGAGAAGAGQGAAGTQGTQGTQGGDGGAGSGTTLLNQGDSDWMPEKFRVNGADGKLDTDASARKLAASYSELEKTRPNGTIPKDPESYDLKDLPEGMKIEDLKADPLYQGFLKGAHAKGMTNEQVGYVLSEYAKLVPELLEADVRIGAAEAKTELGKVWGDDKAVAQNLQFASRAVRGFGSEGDKAGAVDRLMQKYGNDPDFLAFAAAVGKEMAEDEPIRSDSPAAQDWEAQVAKLKANPAYADERHPEHRTVMAQVNALYSKRYGNKTQKLGGSRVT